MNLFEIFWNRNQISHFKAEDGRDLIIDFDALPQVADRGEAMYSGSAAKKGRRPFIFQSACEIFCYI